MYEQKRPVRVVRLLTKMYDTDPALYERIMDTPVFAKCFNELSLLAQGEWPDPQQGEGDG